MAVGTALVSLPFSIVICHGAIIVYLVLWALEGHWKEKFHRLRTDLLPQLVLLLAILQLIGIAYSENQEAGWFSLERKIFFFLLPVALATGLREWTKNDLRMLFYSFSIGCFAAVAICGGYALQQSIEFANSAQNVSIDYLTATGFKDLNPSVRPEWLFFSYTGLADGISIHPAYLSLYLGFCCLFLLREMLTAEIPHPARFALAALVLIFTVAIVFLSSRIILLCMLITYSGVVIYYLLMQRKRLTSIMVGALLFLILIVVYANPVSWYRNWQELAMTPLTIKKNYLYTTSAEMRASLWWLGWKSFRQVNPLTGAGTGDVLVLMEATARAHEISNSIDSKNPHNQYLYLLIGNGVIALLVFLLYLLVPFYKALKGRDYLMVALTFLFAALCLTETALELQKGIVFFSIVHSLLAFQRPANEVRMIDLTLSRAAN